MDQQAKQQVVDRIKQAESVLVTVNANPNVDQLAACIGLTLLLNKMGKRGTAVFSGKVPSTIKFLQPEKTLETNTDSLRDFIVSLDKAKADKLRYKVEDQVVRIFITHYKTTISEKDLVFSQGEINVDVVVALGIDDRAHIDKAITAHGRILHDATVISLNAGAGKDMNLGQINWRDPSSSSLSEMLVSISESFGPGLIDNQIATAFLTGIVAETERFSNKKTSPKVMTMSAQLMAAGANQQLVVTNLEPPPPPPAPKPKVPPKATAPAEKPAPKPEEKKDNKGTLNIAHEKSEKDSPEVKVDPNEIRIDQQGNLKTAQDYLKETQQKQQPQAPESEQPSQDSGDARSALISLPPLGSEAPADGQSPGAPGSQGLAGAPLGAFEELPSAPTPSVSDDAPLVLPPKTPQTAVTESEANRHALLDPLSRTPPAFGNSFTADTSAAASDGSKETPIDPLNNPLPGETGFMDHQKVVTPPPPAPNPLDQLLAQQNNPAPQPPQTSADTPLPPPQQSTQPPILDSARNAVENAYASVPFNPDLNPKNDVGSTPLGPDLHSGTAPPPMPPPIPPIPGTTPPSNNF